MARPGGLELPTFWFVARRSIQLSYGRTKQSLTQSNRYSHFLRDSNFDFRPAAAIKNFFDADAECFAQSRPVAPQRMKSIRICVLIIGKFAKWFITSLVKHGRRCCFLLTKGMIKPIFSNYAGAVPDRLR